MILEEVLEHCTDPKKPIGNRVGDKQVLIFFLPEKNCYTLQENRPWVAGSSRVIGECRTKEEIKVRITDVSFASEMDPNGWIVDIDRW